MTKKDKPFRRWYELECWCSNQRRFLTGTARDAALASKCMHTKQDEKGTYQVVRVLKTGEQVKVGVEISR